MEASARMTKNAATARALAAESMVLLKNVGNTLPLLGSSEEPVPVALFGVGQIYTVKGGTGSGNVNNLKTISLLSGGEKAFVAIALYFSILKVHPTPFCVMDEIEAALDDANVTRYARYMRTLAGRTQFIVITHRRGTMEEADVLYGVTMQEQGVSKILTINLNDMAKELKIK